MITDQLIHKAIVAAINQDWLTAIELNQQILSTQPNDIATLNRLARAYKAQGLNQEAKDIYLSVLKLDKYNAIALKNIQLLELNHFSDKNVHHQSITSFIDEPGKTATASLCKIANFDVICQLEAGQPLKLIPMNHWISVNTIEDTRIGILADVAFFRLKRLINGGNRYQVAVKSISTDRITVFIRETHRDTQFQDTPSFNL